MGSFQAISPSAFPVARSRAENTDIPYTKKIAEVLGLPARTAFDSAKDLVKALLGESRHAQSYLEIRYKSTNDALGSLDDFVVLEVAAGLSPRGLAFTDLGVPYIETDLSGMIEQKRSLVEEIRARQGVGIYEHHRFVSLDACDSSQFGEVGETVKELDSPNVAIIMEGFLEYLSLDEKRKARDNIRAFLEEYSPSGVWITPDLSKHSGHQNLYDKLLRARNRITTRRDKHLFDSHNDVREFLSEGGFNGELLDNSHLMDNLTCLEKGLVPSKSTMEMYRAYRISLAE